MKLYVPGAKLYVVEGGAIRTKRSRESFMKVMRLLQSQYPAHHVHDFSSTDLTAFCLTRGDGKPGNPAPSTVRNRRAHVRAFFDWATWKGLAPSNPGLELKFTVKPGNGHVRIGTWLSEQQVGELLRSYDLSDQQDRRDRLVIMFGVMTGLRLFEIAGLSWDAFSADYSSVKIHGKGDKLVEVPLPRQLQEAVREWKREAYMGASAVIPSFRWVWNPGKGKRVLIPMWDAPLGDAGVGYVLKRASELIGVKVTPHDLRRSFAGILEAKGMSLKDIQLLMRHENLATTDRYLSNNPARAKKLAGGLEFDL